MNVKQLEQAAVQGHADGTDWSAFWADHAADVAALGLDYYARGQFVHRLVGLVVSGDADGQRPAGDRLPWSDSEPPCYPADDSHTADRRRPVAWHVASSTCCGHAGCDASDANRPRYPPPLEKRYFPEFSGGRGFGEQGRTTRDSFCNTTKNFH